MKLLFDQNLSPRLVGHLSDLYPDSTHVYLIGLDQEADSVVWNYARHHEYIVVSRDADFSELSVLAGFPPKLIWIRRGSCSTQDIESILRLNYEAVKSLGEDPGVGILTLF